MKKTAALFLAIILAAFSGLALADYDGEITFRNVPWGSSASAAEQLLSTVNWVGGPDSLSGYTISVITDKDGYGSYGINVNDGICFYEMTYPKKYTVAGYETEYSALYFAWTPDEDGHLPRKEPYSSLYCAGYTFESMTESMAEDIYQKLCSVYGEPSSSGENKYTWKGANDTMLVMKYKEDDHKLNIYYAWEKGDELLQQADEAMTKTKVDAAGSGDTSGL